MLPPLGNQAIDLLKATSVVSLITVADMTFRAQQIRSLTGQTLEAFTMILVAYFVLSTVIGSGVKMGERRFAIGPTKRIRARAGIGTAA
jgi:polar amino acid transport system permease protein